MRACVGPMMRVIDASINPVRAGQSVTATVRIGMAAAACYGGGARPLMRLFRGVELARVDNAARWVVVDGRVLGLHSTRFIDAALARRRDVPDERVWMHLFHGGELGTCIAH